MSDIFRHNAEWIEEMLAKDPNYFEELSKGQSPDYFFIGCSDSRISVESLMNSEIGGVFVHRNIANIAPNNDFNFTCALNYAVSHLKVKHIIICGHYYCGGVQAAMGSEDLGFLNPWLRNVRDVYRLHYDELNSIEDFQQRSHRLVELNVIEQCVNVAKTVDVQNAYRNREIYLHGWVFDLKTGKIIDLGIDIDIVMQRLDNIYRLE